MECHSNNHVPCDFRFSPYNINWCMKGGKEKWVFNWLNLPNTWPIKHHIRSNLTFWKSQINYVYTWAMKSSCQHVEGNNIRQHGEHWEEHWDSSNKIIILYDTTLTLWAHELKWILYSCRVIAMTSKYLFVLYFKINNQTLTHTYIYICVQYAHYKIYIQILMRSMIC